MVVRYAPLPKNIESLLPDAFGLLRADPDIVFAYLFGGLARGKPTPLSDVDIAVYLREQASCSNKKLELVVALTSALKTDEIDLVILNRAPLTLRMKILQNKRVVVDKMPFLRHRLESQTMREFFDFSVKEKAILRRRFLNGR